MKRVCCPNRSAWHDWLEANHASTPEGIWLVFDKKQTGKVALRYEEALEEALCFGWIDSILKRIDDRTYCRKFTPRKDNSRWSISNVNRVTRLIAQGAMTEFGMAKVTAAKRLGTWGVDPRPVIALEPPAELSAALAKNQVAKAYFESLPPSHRKQFIGWLVTAKRPETKLNRVRECVALLAKGRNLGLK